MTDWPRVKELFHAALEREPSERGAFLHASCGNNAAVREQVERLLAAHDQAAGFIEQSPVALAGQKYVELAPREPNPYDSLVEAHLISGAAAKAVELYSRAQTIDPTFAASRNHLSVSLAVMGRHEEAIAAKPPLKSVEGFLLSRVGRYREAFSVLDTGKQQAERDESVAEQSEYSLISSFLALERKDFARARRELLAAEKAAAGLTGARQRRHRVLIHLLSGIAELGAGRPDTARTRLNLSRQLFNAGISEEKLWHHALEGEIALANRDVEGAAKAFAAGEPQRRRPFNLRGWVTLMEQSFPYRDGLARVAKAQGDLRRAIQIYRQLLVYGPDSKFVPVLEPRYVLELARLLEQARDKAEARKEYERFLQMWMNADADLPELAEVRRAVARLGTRPAGPT
jgi:tetratricopeptide (TPR) repeat protein